ncbi:MAG: elongation factor P [Pseudomonadota bacterium]
MPKINGNEIRPGNVLQLDDGALWVAVKTNHVKPGKGGAFAQVELKNIVDGRKLNERFRSSDKVERVRLEQKDYQYLFDGGDAFTFMDDETYEQIELQKDWVGDQAVFLQEGMKVVIEFFEETPLGLTVPEQVTIEVEDTEPVVKGQTAANSFKPATCTNGVRVMVPPFVGVGEKIVVQTADSTYLRRAD